MAFAGSLRSGSYNRRLIPVLAQGARAAGAQVSLIELRDYSLPVYDGDIEAEAMPENARRLQELMAQHDGLLISTPEYNGSMPALVKNTLDWISRPLPDGRSGTTLFADKVAGIVSASPGPLGGLRSLLVLRDALAKLGLLPRPRWGWQHSGVRKILKLMVPTLFGSSVAQLNLLLNTALASFLIVGSVSWLYLTDRLLEFPLGMFGVAIGTVILPHLSKRHAATDSEGYSKALDWGFRLCLLIGVPACLGLVLCAEALIAALFQYGRLTPQDTQMIRLSLMAQSTAVPAFLLVKVLAPAFYSRQDTKTPVKSAVVSVAVNLISTVVLLLLAVYLTDAGRAALARGAGLTQALGEVPGAHACLALAIAIAGWTNALQLAWSLRRARVYRRQPGWGRFLRQIGVASLGLSAVVRFLLWLWPGWTGWPWWERAWKLAAVVGAGGAAYGALLWLQGIRPRDLRGH